MRHVIAACAAAGFFAACSTAAGPTEVADAKPDPRQGKEVNQICFQQQIRNWRENDRRSIIVEKGVNEEYKLELIGTCQPNDAFLNIGLVSRGGSSCLSEGDRLITDARYNDGPCSIRKIYEWNKDAGPAANPS